MSNESEDIYEIPYLLCTQCGHDLNHPLYTIMQHPVIPVPLCVLCFDETQERYEDRIADTDNNEDDSRNNEDLCSWCLNDAESTLFLCDNPDGCAHQFCSSCIEDNLGSKCLQTIESNDSWLCFVCAPDQLSGFQEAIRIGKGNSRLEELKQLDTDGNTSANATENLQEQKVKKIAEVLSSIVEQQQESLKRLDEEALNQQENEIRKELMKKNPSER